MSKRSALRITTRTVETKDTLFRGRGLAGFGMRAHATWRKVRVVQSRGPGGLKRATLGHHGEVSTEAARKQATVFIDRIKSGEDSPPPPPERWPASPSVACACT